MRIDKLYIDEFKNLRDFSIDLDESNMHTILLGQNAAGKSNLLEALVIIFRDLDLEDQTMFNYILDYKCKDQNLRIVGGPKTKGNFQIYHITKSKSGLVLQNTKPISKKLIKQNKSDYFPKYVFSYYSGVSNRLLEHFDKHQFRFYKALLDGVDAPQRPLFYARLIHSHFVLLAFYGFKEEVINKFLEEYLDIIGLESVLFVLKKPQWKGDKKHGDSRFWYAKGVVKDFLNDLWDASMAPIYSKEKIREDFNKHPEQEQLYLYISNQSKLQNIAEKYGSNTEFFKSLESTYISDLIQEIRVKVRKRNVNGEITFKELSEGEQQLLTVLGLLRFTKDEESLILLDEPDTHLNPLWKWKYMNLLEEVVQKPKSTQILMTTHDPLVIGGLTKEEIRIFKAIKGIDSNGEEYQTVKTFEPDFDPKGLGVAGILTSELFNLPSSLDYETENKVIRQYDLLSKERHGKLTKKEQTELFTLNQYLDSIGFNQTSIDPLYDKFIDELLNYPEFNYKPQTESDHVKQDQLIMNVLKKIVSKE